MFAILRNGRLSDASGLRERYLYRSEVVSGPLWILLPEQQIALILIRFDQQLSSVMLIRLFPFDQIGLRNLLVFHVQPWN